MTEDAGMTSTGEPRTDPSSPRRPLVAPEGDVYRLGHRWVITGPIEVVFDVLSRSRDYPTWWVPCFKSAETDNPEVVVGARAHLRVGARLPYELVWDITIVEVDRPHVLTVDTILRLSGRFPMRGPIRYTLTEGPDGVEVVNEQLIVAERRLSRPLRALAQRAFAYNHAWAFKIGGRGLQKKVDEVVAGRAAAAVVPVG
jgi:uncharacterized protein YndB with AHSA1/START domain